VTHGYPPEAIRRLAAFHVVRLGFAAVHEDRLNLKLPAQVEESLQLSCSRSTFLRTLPDAVSGKASTKIQLAGVL